MNQTHILVCFRFPEDDSECGMSYAANEEVEARADAVNFSTMYPGTLFVSVIYVYHDGREEELWRWSNPQSAKLTALANNAGPAGITFHMPSDIVPSAGLFFQRLSKRFSDTRLSLRPPLEGQFASPLPSTSKPYGGRNRRTRRGLRR